MKIFKRIFAAADSAADRMLRDKEVSDWLNDLGDAEKREKDWRKKAATVVELYEQQKSDQTEYNILYANTETLSPAVYNNTPRPVVKRKVDKDNPLGIACALVLKNVLVYLTDTADRDKAAFDDLQKSAVLEALVPGRGEARFSYSAEIEDVPPTAEQLAENPAAQPSPRIKYECVEGNQVPWNRVVYGYAKNWHQIPWKAYEHFMTQAECIDNFGEELGKKIKLTHLASAQKEDEEGKGEAGPADAEGVKFAHIWEIWDKRTKKVIFVSEGFPKVIKMSDDPYGLDGFFDSPRPVMFLQRVSSLQPQTLYQMYEKQAEELEKATRRIGGLLTAMKVRGFYDGTLEGLDDLLTKPENTLLPARNVAALQQGMTLEKAIWFMPLETLIVVLQQLYAARIQIINTIHQITGIADIMRGASQASETLGAQEIKQAWGTMRLKRMQKEVHRFARDCYRIQAELAAKHFGLETLKMMTGLKFPMQAEKEQAAQFMQQAQAMMQQSAQAGQQVPPDPRMQQAQAVLAKPAWEDILNFLKNDSLRNYAIDIETNSTIDIEATEDKQELAELMNSLAQLMNGAFPMVKEGVLPFQAAKALTLSVIQKFRMGDDVEETFRALQEPQQKADPAQQKVEAEMERDKQSHALDMEAKQEELRMKKEIAMMELEIKREELRFQREELAMKMEAARNKHRMDMEMLAAKAVLPPAAPQSTQGAQNAGA